MLAHPLVRRLLSPVGLLLVAICFGLPFVAVSCESPGVTVTAEYTGTDLLVGGTPSVSVTGDQVSQESAEEEADDPIDVQPAAVLALLAIISGIGVAALPGHRRRLVGAAAAAGATLLLLVINQVLVQNYLSRQVEDEIGTDLPAGSSAGDFISARYGFWLALAVALTVTAYNGFELFRYRRHTTAPDPAAAEPELDAGLAITPGTTPAAGPPVHNADPPPPLPPPGEDADPPAVPTVG